MADSDWIFMPSGGAVQFTDTDDANGDTTKQTVETATFRRMKIYDLRGLATFSVPSNLGDEAEGATLTAYQGTTEMRADVIHTSSARKYVCTDDRTFAGGGVGFPSVTREQTWEKIVEPAEYTWPES